MIASRIYYYVVCDHCERRADYHPEYPEAWRTPDLAVNTLPPLWTSDGVHHHCSACPPLNQEVPC